MCVITGDSEACVFYYRQQCATSMSQPWWQNISHGKVRNDSVFCETIVKFYKAAKTSESHSEGFEVEICVCVSVCLSVCLSVCVCVCVCVSVCVHPYTILLLFSHLVMLDSLQLHGACQAPLSVGFPREEYWSGLPFPSILTHCFF